VAFLIVLALLVSFGAELESLPPALKALVFTGILVPLMGNFVMPTLSVAVADALGRTGAGERPRDAAKHPQLDARSARVQKNGNEAHRRSHSSGAVRHRSDGRTPAEVTRRSRSQP
jgi:hypothetical protein